MAKTFQLSVITPEKAVLNTDQATFVAVPGHDGEFGILAHRAPLLARLGVGWLRAHTEEGNHELLVDGGFVQVVGNKVSVLTERAERPAEIDPAKAKAALEAAEAMEAVEESAFEARQRALARARAQVRVAGR